MTLFLSDFQRSRPMVRSYSCAQTHRRPQNQCLRVRFDASSMPLHRFRDHHWLKKPCCRIPSNHFETLQPSFTHHTAPKLASISP